MVERTIDSKQQTGERETARPFCMKQRLAEISKFFAGTGRVHQAMQRVADVFSQHDIVYVIAGGMAVNAHKHQRTTGDVDFIVRAEGLTAIRALVQQGVFNAVANRSRRFVEPSTGITAM